MVLTIFEIVNIWMLYNRLRSEMKNLMKKPDSGISVSLPDDSNVFLWKANIVAPRGSVYEGIYILSHIYLQN